MRYREKQNPKKGMGRWKGTGALLLALFLTACGGERTEGSDAAPSGAVRLEDIGQSMPEQTGALEDFRTADGNIPQTEGSMGDSGAEAPSQGQAEADSSGQGQSAPEPAAPEARQHGRDS